MSPSPMARATQLRLPVDEPATKRNDHRPAMVHRAYSKNERSNQITSVGGFEGMTLVGSPFDPQPLRPEGS